MDYKIKIIIFFQSFILLWEYKIWFDCFVFTFGRKALLWHTDADRLESPTNSPVEEKC